MLFNGTKLSINKTVQEKNLNTILRRWLYIP